MRARTDWNYLLDDMLIPAISVVCAALVLVASWWFHDREEAIFDIYSSNQNAIHEDYDALVYRRRLIDRYHRRYKEFQQTGFVGMERRLDWIETIRTVATGLDLPSVNYSLEPQRAVAKPVESASDADIQIRLSRLELELGLVHELDLLRFFRRLQAEAPGLMKVDQCSLVRVAASDQALKAEANITANCSLQVFSVITSDITNRGGRI